MLISDIFWWNVTGASNRKLKKEIFGKRLQYADCTYWRPPGKIENYIKIDFLKVGIWKRWFFGQILYLKMFISDIFW